MKEAYNYIDNLLEKNDTVVISLSGGPDSMALLSLLLPYIKKKSIKIIGAHVNHGVRKESAEEEQFVRDYCEKHGVVFELLTIKEYNKKNFHDDARIQRYNFLDEIMNRYQAKYLFTAHHGDDLIETILMRIERGSNLSGYAGFRMEMTHHNYKVIRPLIEVTKQQIIEYNKEHNIPYCIDYTNNEDEYKRNRYRHHVLPILKEENNDIQKKYYKYSKELTEYYDYVNSIIVGKNIIQDDRIIISKLLAEDSFIIKKTIEFYIKNIQQDYEFYMTDGLVKEIIKCLKTKKPNAQVDLTNGFIGIKSYDSFTIKKRQVDDEYDTILNDAFENDNWIIKTDVTAHDNTNYTFLFSSKEISLPIHIRTKKQGDVICVKNLNGKKKIKDIMIENKIPMLKRKTYPLIVDSNNVILGIPGLKKSQFAKDKSEKYDIIIKCKEK